jgi:hypothetical protein
MPKENPTSPTSADRRRWREYNLLVCGHPHDHKSPAEAIACCDSELEEMYLLENRRNR